MAKLKGTNMRGYDLCLFVVLDVTDLRTLIEKLYYFFLNSFVIYLFFFRNAIHLETEATTAYMNKRSDVPDIDGSCEVSKEKNCLFRK